MIVITAPTGNIGRRLLSLLVEAAPAHGQELRVVVRDPARLPESVRGRVEVVTGSHGDAATVDRAFAGADAVFWLVPPDPGGIGRRYGPVVHCAAAHVRLQGEGRVVRN
ncbi:NAD(P)H-binding protein, partial [Streptomyces sp. NPDC001193]